MSETPEDETEIEYLARKGIKDDAKWEVKAKALMAHHKELSLKHQRRAEETLRKIEEAEAAKISAETTDADRAAHWDKQPKGIKK